MRSIHPRGDATVASGVALLGGRHAGAAAALESDSTLARDRAA